MGRETYKKQITTPELLAQINPDNQELVKLFLKDKSRKCSDATIVQYTSALNIFFTWVVVHCRNKFYPEISKREISSFFDYLLDELKINGKRFAFFKSVLSGLSDCVIKYYDEDERCAKFRNFISAVIDNISKEPVRDKTVWEEEDIEKVLTTLQENKEYESACLLALGVYSGMRISELVQVKVDWIQEDRLAYGGLFYETPKMRTKGSGKQGKILSRLILHDLFKPYYDAWIKERAIILATKNIECDALFINTHGEPASQSVIRSICSSWEDILHKPCYIHSLRHAFTTLLKNKYKLSSDVIKNIVKWSSVDLVALYNDKDDEIDSEELDQLRLLITKETTEMTDKEEG